MSIVLYIATPPNAHLEITQNNRKTTRVARIQVQTVSLLGSPVPVYSVLSKLGTGPTTLPCCIQHGAVVLCQLL